MRTVKIMLVTIGILAVAGGVLAFKAKRVNICYYERIGSPGVCSFANQDIFKTGMPMPFGNVFNTTIPRGGAECPELALCPARYEKVRE